MNAVAEKEQKPVMLGNQKYLNSKPPA